MLHGSDDVTQVDAVGLARRTQSVGRSNTDRSTQEASSLGIIRCRGLLCLDAPAPAWPVVIPPRAVFPRPLCSRLPVDLATGRRFGLCFLRIHAGLSSAQPSDNAHDLPVPEAFAVTALLRGALRGVRVIQLVARSIAFKPRRRLAAAFSIADRLVNTNCRKAKIAKQNNGNLADTPFHQQPTEVG
jgi:hypothetical protein